MNEAREMFRGDVDALWVNSSICHLRNGPLKIYLHDASELSKEAWSAWRRPFWHRENFSVSVDDSIEEEKYIACDAKWNLFPKDSFLLPLLSSSDCEKRKNEISPEKKGGSNLKPFPHIFRRRKNLSEFECFVVYNLWILNIFLKLNLTVGRDIFLTASSREEKKTSFRHTSRVLVT